MPLRFPVWFPEMPMTLVRRASAKLPRNNFIFRTDPKWTKQEIKEYLVKLYDMDVERVATINYLGQSHCHF
jgi:large subunit ribosomal protein L23